jgi:solute carrier family 15 (peptide/histidine transporter), member 3/4
MNYFVHLVRFLYKGCINRGKDGAWSHCSVAKVEKTKIVLRLLPLFLSSMIGYVSSPILLTFTVQHGGMTNTRLGKIHVSPATLFIIPITFQTVMLAVYDQFIVTFLTQAHRLCQWHHSLAAHQHRIHLHDTASVIAALVERKRKQTATQMSLFWLTPQFFLLGVVDVTSFPGLLEFFNSEAPRSMKSIATALFWCEIGLSSVLATFLVQVVNKATRHAWAPGWVARGRKFEQQPS